MYVQEALWPMYSMVAKWGISLKCMWAMFYSRSLVLSGVMSENHLLDTLGNFFIFKVIGVNRGKNRAKRGAHIQTHKNVKLLVSLNNIMGYIMCLMVLCTPAYHRNDCLYVLFLQWITTCHK